MGFSRGLFTGWLRGVDNQRLVHARFGKKRGVFLGVVGRVRGGRVFLRLEAPLKAGDGVVFDAGHPDKAEEGGRVYNVDVQPDGSVSLSFGPGPDLAKVKTGDKLWKTNDPALDRSLRQSFAGDVPRFQRPLDFEAHGAAGIPLTLIVRDGLGNVASVDSTVPLAPAEQRPLTPKFLAEQLGRLGGSPFLLGRLDNYLEGAVMLPVSELNRMRRDAVAELERLRTLPRRWTLGEAAAVVAAPVPVPARKEATHAGPGQLNVLVRSLAQLDSVLESGVATIYCDFDDPKQYREAVRRARQEPPELPDGSRRTIWVAPPRIFKTGEEWILKQVRSAEADGYLARNYDHLRYFAGERCVGDFSLNVANHLAAEYLKGRYALERLTASYDLNAQQLESLLLSAPPVWFEVTIHLRMPMFHMEHCVFCAFLSKGTDYHDCGRPCDKHTVTLRDRVGLEHPLRADAGCRNTVFNARAQTGAESVERLRALGLRHFRVEFVGESAGEVSRVISRYQALLRGEIDGAELWRELKLQNQLGVTRGQMEREEARKVFPRRAAVAATGV